MCRYLGSSRLHRCLTKIGSKSTGFKLLLRRYSRVSDLNISKNQRKKAILQSKMSIELFDYRLFEI